MFLSISKKTAELLLETKVFSITNEPFHCYILSVIVYSKIHIIRRLGLYHNFDVFEIVHYV